MHRSAASHNSGASGDPGKDLFAQRIGTRQCSGGGAAFLSVESAQRAAAIADQFGQHRARVGARCRRGVPQPPGAVDPRGEFGGVDRRRCRGEVDALYRFADGWHDGMPGAARDADQQLMVASYLGEVPHAERLPDP
ncbi:hypothetical protein [Nocardia sp. CY41]|uniref:hypothetical protein n=1 Tax=Nocardia sp. CY41 TaxID=2608686 RepID=UPI0019161A13|nr:hypothetical protein [Nocardia sp. CY41]